MQTVTSVPCIRSDQVHKRRTRNVWGSWIKRVLLGFGALVVILVGAGTLYQVIGTALDQRNFPPPGQLVDVGGYRLHIHA